MKIKKNLWSLLLITMGIVITSCSDDDDNPPATTNLEVNLNGLEDLGPDYVYEGWIIVNGLPVSTGIFTVDANNALSETSFSIDADQLSNATAFVLTIEPTNDPDSAPSVTKLLSGNFEDDTAIVSIDEQVGDFANASGTFFLRTPTDEDNGMNNGNDEYGVWFGTPGMPPTPNLTLPSLQEGWIYEGWVVVDGVGPLSTGQFEDAASQTADNADPFSGPNPGPPVPGEDFFLNAPDGFDFPLDIRGRTVVVSVEPFPDNAAGPFLLKPLLGVSGDETAPATHDLSLNSDSFPTGWARR